MTHTGVNVVTDAVRIRICLAPSTTNAQRIQLVAIAVAIAGGNAITSAREDRTRTVAHATGIKRSYAIIDIVTDAIGIFICRTSTTAHPERIELVALAIAIASRDLRTATFIDVTRTVAHATRIQFSHTLVDIVTNAIGVGVLRAFTTADTEGVELVAVAVAVTFRDVNASTLVDVAGAVAFTACVQFTDTGIDVVTNAISIHIGCTGSAANAQGVKLVALAVAIAFRDASTTACKHRAWTVAHAASVQFSHTFVDIVTNAIHVVVCGTISAAFTERIQCVAIAIAIASRDTFTAAFINLTWTVAHTTRVRGTHAVIHIVADAIGIDILQAIASTFIQCVKLVAVAVAVAFWDAVTPTHSAFVKLVAGAVALSLRNARASAHATLIQRKARTVFIRGFRIVVARRNIGAARNLVRVADAITIKVKQHHSTAQAHFTNLIRIDTK